MAAVGRAAMRLALAVLFLQPAVTQTQKRQTCRLQSIVLRSSNQPVDLLPPFDSGTFAYFASLDFAMDSFSIDAVPVEGCMTDRVPNQAIPVLSDGKAVAVTIFAKSPNATSEFEGMGEQEYTVEVSRLMGTETMVDALRIVGGKLDPPFNEQRRDYKVALGLSEELIEIQYVLRDAGQKVRCAATPQALTTSGAQQGSAASETETGTEQAGRRLLSTGEVQYRWRHQVFPVDAGFSRTVTLTLESADPMEARVAEYKLEVHREGCNIAKPFYDPLSEACVINCPAGYYQNLEINRCSKCNTNCRVCISLQQCELCDRDTVHSSFVLKPDGSCKEERTSLFDKYYWWCISFGLFLGLLALMVLVMTCQCLFSFCCGCCNTRSHGYSYDTDSEGEFDSERYG